jgi:hypothetical protein
MAILEDDLAELIKIISTAIEKARQFNMNQRLYSIDGAGGSNEPAKARRDKS